MGSYFYRDGPATSTQICLIIERMPIQASFFVRHSNWILLLPKWSRHITTDMYDVIIFLFSYKKNADSSINLPRTQQGDLNLMGMGVYKNGPATSCQLCMNLYSSSFLLLILLNLFSCLFFKRTPKL